jgi:hypothetical protein
LTGQGIIGWDSLSFFWVDVEKGRRDAAVWVVMPSKVAEKTNDREGKEESNQI